MPDELQTTKSRRERLLAAVERIGIPEAVRRIKSVVDETTVEAGARLEFPTGHLIDVHELWKGQWLYQVWPPGVETQGQFDRLIRMKAEDFEQEVAARGGKRVR